VRQGDVYPVCGDTLFNDEELQIHHRIPRAHGGTDAYANLELVHDYCHQQIHAGNGELIDVPTHEPTRSWLRTWFT
jgi:5-methylcytosine-specific restriction endonuclease McrA